MPKTRIFIVDDHYFVRLGLSECIQTQPDMEVVGGASCAEEAMALFNSLRPDVMLVDLVLPGKSGADLTAEITSAHPEARILIISTFQGVEDVYGAFQAGAKGYLLKSMDPETRISGIRAVMTGRTFLPPVIAEILNQRIQRPGLSPREVEVLRCIVQGLSNKEIANALGITEGTVKLHVHKVLEKLSVSDRTQAATAALRQGLFRS